MEPIKVYTCGARAIFVESPENCLLLKNGNCKDGKACDAVEVVVIPEARHAKTQAALAAAEEILSSLDEISTESWAGIAAGSWVDMSEVREALALIREAKGAEDD